MAIVNGSLQVGYKNSAWFTANPTVVLKEGQIVYLEQTGTYKLGDGVTQLSALTFLGGGGTVDVNTIGAAINGATSATPNDTDLVMSVDTSVAKKNTWTQIKAFLKTYFDTVYATITDLTGYVKKGTLTTNYIPKATASDTIGDSTINYDGSGNLILGNGSKAVSTNGLYPLYSGFGNSFETGFLGVNNDISVNGNLLFKGSGFTKIYAGGSNDLYYYSANKHYFLSTTLNIDALNASQIVATDASKNLQSLDTATYPSLTELSYAKGVTSAIQTQLDAKANNLIAKINTAIAHTGTTNETILNSSTPISGFEANDFIKFQSSIFANNSANNKILRIYVNTSHSLVGATLLASCTITSQTGGVAFIRNLWFKNSLSAQGVFTVSTSLTTDETLASNVGDTSLTYNFSGTNYLIISGTLPTSSADTLTLKWFRAEIIR